MTTKSSSFLIESLIFGNVYSEDDKIKSVEHNELTTSQFYNHPSSVTKSTISATPRNNCREENLQPILSNNINSNILYCPFRNTRSIENDSMNHEIFYYPFFNISSKANDSKQNVCSWKLSDNLDAINKIYDCFMKDTQQNSCKNFI
ncbi:unnamed protein product [Gordionus sp. m RMFG-2023]